MRYPIEGDSKIKYANLNKHKFESDDAGRFLDIFMHHSPERMMMHLITDIQDNLQGKAKYILFW
jgi:hypothetical protein